MVCGFEHAVQPYRGKVQKGEAEGPQTPGLRPQRIGPDAQPASCQAPPPGRWRGGGPTAAEIAPYGLQQVSLPQRAVLTLSFSVVRPTAPTTTSAGKT